MNSAMRNNIMWKPITELPELYNETKRMFVVCAKVTEKSQWGASYACIGYITDPYCVWRNKDGSYARWPHPFEPTHFYELPVEGI